MEEGTARAGPGIGRECVRRMIRALIRTSTGLDVRDVPSPVVGAGMVRIETRCSLISPGSELGGWGALRERRPKAPHDVVFGYSATGVVAELGQGVSGLTVGDRVAAIGAGYACHATSIVVPANLVVALPAGVSFEDGSYAMLLATALFAVRRAGLHPGDRVLVAGLGILGNLTAQILRRIGCRVAGWDISATALDFAHRVRIEPVMDSSSPQCIDATRQWTRGEGLDVAIWAMNGSAEALWDKTVACMKVSPDGHPTGRIVVVGHGDFTFKTRPMTNIDVVQASRTGPGYHDPAWERGGDYPPVHVRWDTRRNLELCMEWLAEGAIDVWSLTSHRLELEGVSEGLSHAFADNSPIMGCVIVYPEGAAAC